MIAILLVIIASSYHVSSTAPLNTISITKAFIVLSIATCPYTYRCHDPFLLAFLLLSGDIDLNSGPTNFTVCTLNRKEGKGRVTPQAHVAHFLHILASPGYTHCWVCAVLGCNRRQTLVSLSVHCRISTRFMARDLHRSKWVSKSVRTFIRCHSYCLNSYESTWSCLVGGRK